MIEVLLYAHFSVFSFVEIVCFELFNLVHNDTNILNCRLNTTESFSMSRNLLVVPCYCIPCEFSKYCNVMLTHKGLGFSLESSCAN